MSNFDPATALSIEPNTINYNLGYSTDVYSSDVQRLTGPGSSQNYFQIKYDNGLNANLTFSALNPSSYIAQNVYFFGLLHNNITGQTTSGTNYTGEIIIEHKNESNSNVVYTCFFVQPDTTNTANTSIDKLKKIANKDDKNTLSGFNLSDIPKQTKYFYYNDTSSPNITVIVFLTPITVSKDTANWFSNLYSSSPFFTTQAPLVQAPVPVKKSAKPTDDNQIYIDCNPSGVSDETITTYNLPINSELMGEKQQMDFMKTSVNFFIFIIATILAYFAIPLLYKRAVIDSITRQDKEGALNGVKPLTRARSIDIFITLIVFAGISVCFVFGFLKDNFQYLSGGLFLLVLFGLSIAIIQANKAGDSWITDSINYKKDGNTIETSLKDFLKVATMNALMFIIVKMGKIYLATLIVIAIALLGIGVYMNTPISESVNKIMFAAIVLLPIAALIKLLL
jgi:hypothetical protein